MAEAIEIGVDIGGTFTDVVVHRHGQPITILKTPSTRGDPAQGVLQALQQISRDFGISSSQIVRFVHGTTVATNAVLERKGAKTGLLTTQGFRDVLEIGRQLRHQLYSAILDPETPSFLAEGAFRKEVVERVGADGGVVTPLDEASVIAAADELAASGVKSVSVCFLFSFLNSSHELRARELIVERHPDIAVSLSCEVDPAYREYERTVVTTFDAYLKPVVNEYLQNLESGLASANVPAPLQVMQSRGGIAAATVARLRPVRLFLSGPAAGVIGGRAAGVAAGASDLITVDIGGTSSDIALITEGKPMIKSDGQVGDYVIRVPMVDVTSIGSGGGSIAWVDGAGSLRVGPESAGAEPGPACYDRGGQQATVTDASVVLGYVNPDNFAGGALTLTPRLARDVIARTIAEPLGLSVEDAALGIHRVINAKMAEGIRLVSVRRGIDPRDFTLVALGGAGPVHATALAQDLGISAITIPRHPGVLSAAGLLAAPIEHEVARAFPRDLDGLVLQDVRAALESLDAEAGALMSREGVAEADVDFQYSADVCYIGQGYHLEVPLVLSAPDPLARLYDDFLVAHDRVYGHKTNAPARVVNLRTVHQVAGGDAAALLGDGGSGNGKAKGLRDILLADESAPISADIYDRAAFHEGFKFAGPAVVEQSDTTVVIEPGWRAEVGAGGNLMLYREERG